MVRPRDPLSVRYDRPAGRLLDRAAARPNTWIETRLPTPSHMRHVVDTHGLTPYERAFTRSLYYQLNGPYSEGWRERQLEFSLQVTWGGYNKLGRLCRIRITSYESGWKHAHRRPDQAYTNNPALQAQEQQL